MPEILHSFIGKYLIPFDIYYKKSIFIRTQPAKVA
jgi:hypothetical protein